MAHADETCARDSHASCAVQAQQDVWDVIEPTPLVAVNLAGSNLISLFSPVPYTPIEAVVLTSV